METFSADFVRLTDLPFVSLLDSPIGTYVIWDARSQSVPTYIGEGDVLARFREHRNRFAHPIDGYVALFECSETLAKKQCVILEALLLHIASDTGRIPKANVADGKWKQLDRLFDKHGVVKVRVKGCDPFAHPTKARRLSGAKEISVYLAQDREGDEVFEVEHMWRSAPGR